MTLFTGSMVATPLITDRLAAMIARAWKKTGQEESWSKLKGNNSLSQNCVLYRETLLYLKVVPSASGSSEVSGKRVCAGLDEIEATPADQHRVIAPAYACIQVIIGGLE